MILNVITPSGVSYEGEVQRFQFLSAKGLMEFLPGHAVISFRLHHRLLKR